MLKNVIKFSFAGIGIAALGIGALYGIDWVRYRASPEYQAYRTMEQIKKEIAEDPYGGDTPEETLRLFIAALKQGNTDLAARYFVYDKQEEWKIDLMRLKEKKLLNQTISDLQNMALTKKTEIKAFFTLVDENNEAISQIIIDKDLLNNKWRIAEF